MNKSCLGPYDPTADVDTEGGWHFFFPISERIPQKDRRSYVRRPSGRFEGETGQRYTPDSVCISTHQVTLPTGSDLKTEALESVFHRRCEDRSTETELNETGPVKIMVAEVVVSKQLATELSEPKVVSDQQLTIAFEFALDRLNQWLGAISMAIKKPIPKVRREALPSRLMFGEGPFEPWQLEDHGPGPIQPAGLFIVNEDWPNSAVEERGKESDELDHWIDASLLSIDIPGPFVRAIELQSQAEIYRRASGDYKVAIILYAAACESLIDDLLQHLLWEKGLLPHEAAEEFMNRRKKSNVVQPKSARTLVTISLYPLLTGQSWKSAKQKSIVNWLNQVVAVRNDIVHNAFEPQYLEMYQCEEAVLEFHQFLASAIFGVRHRFPITAIAFLGEDGLANSDDWKSLKGLAGTSKKVRERMERFRRWSNHVAAIRKAPNLFGSQAKVEDSSAHVAFENGVPVKAFAVHNNETMCLEIKLAWAQRYEPFLKLIEANVQSDKYSVAKFRDDGGFLLPPGARWNLYVYEAIRPFPLEPPRLQS